MWDTNGGVYFGFGIEDTEGKEPDQPGPEYRYADDRHLVTIGPNGSGKSKRVLFPNLAMLTDWSMLVVDPKGELAAMTKDHRAQAGSEIVLLNPFDVLGLGGSRFNPIAVLDPKSDDFIDDALGLAEAIIRVEGREPHWSASAQEVTAGFIIYSRLKMGEKQPPGEPLYGSLPHVRSLLSLPAKLMREAVDVMLEAADKHDCPELVAKVARLKDITPEHRELNSIISTALTQTKWLDSRRVSQSLSPYPPPHDWGPVWPRQRSNNPRPFDFARMKQRPVTVYLILPANRLVTQSNWLRLIITAALQALMKDLGAGAKVPVLLMLDEFAQLGHLPAVENNLAMMRGYGIKLWAVYQDLSQAKATYGERWESLISNAGMVHCFAPQDNFSADFISKLTGLRPAKLGAANQGQTVNPTGLPSLSDALNLSIVQIPMMYPQELRRMKNGRAIVLSHKMAGPAKTYLPYPPKFMPQLAPLVALDPSA